MSDFRPLEIRDWPSFSDSWLDLSILMGNEEDPMPTSGFHQDPETKLITPKWPNNNRIRNLMLLIAISRYKLRGNSHEVSRANLKLASSTGFVALAGFYEYSKEVTLSGNVVSLTGGRITMLNTELLGTINTLPDEESSIYSRELQRLSIRYGLE